MVPMHRGGVKDTAALGAGAILLQRPKPLDLFSATNPRLGHAELTALAVVAGVVSLTTLLAPGLPRCSPAMERIEGFHLSASTAPLHGLNASPGA